MQYLPRTGPLKLDCRHLDAAATVLRVRMMVAKVRQGARRLDVQVHEPVCVDALGRWARRHMAPCTFEPCGDSWRVTVFLLPDEFGEPPRASLGEGARPRTPAVPTRVAA